MDPWTHLPLKELCSLAETAAKEAGRYIQSQFDQQYATKAKEGGDSLASQVVTTVDLAAQAIILRHLGPSLDQYGLGLLTEETPDDRSRREKELFWCIDPMDGTLPFVERRTGYAVSIALISKQGDPVIGVVYIPDEAACYTAIKHQGIVRNGRPFSRKNLQKEALEDSTLHVYMDASFKKAPYFQHVTERLGTLVDHKQIVRVDYHDRFGGVRNALSVMLSQSACYFKFPKERKGGGSTWDYAATRLFFEELKLPVSDAQGARLDLNPVGTTFMHQSGILYATDPTLANFIVALGNL